MSDEQCEVCGFSHGHHYDCENLAGKSELAVPAGSPSDTELLDYLTKLITHCPHTEILYNDDPDVELPVGFTIRVEGCEIVETTAPTLRECIVKDMRKSPDRVGASTGSDAIEEVVRDLTNSRHWPWTSMLSYCDAARAVLHLMAEKGLIEEVRHPMGGEVYRVNGKLFGRTDGITNVKFEILKRQNADLSH